MRTHATHPGDAPVGHPPAHRARRQYLEAPAKTPQASPDVTREQIERRAYELYLARGERPGDALGDWLAAERELKGALPVIPRLTPRHDRDLAH